MGSVFKSYPLHPLFVGLFPVLSLLAANTDNTPLFYAYTPFLISLLGSMLLWGAFYLVTRKYYAAALSASWCVVLFFFYGHIFELLNQGLRHRHLLMLWGIFLFVGIVAAYRISKKSEKRISYIANIVAATLVFISCVQIGLYKIEMNIRNQPVPDHLASFAIELGGIMPPKTLPDIYYIVVDGYASEWAHKNVFKNDISDFTGYLTEHGFYTVPHSTTNYSRTSYSLPSTFNMEYLDTLAGSSKQEVIDSTLLDLIENNRLINFMKGEGYRTIFVGSPSVLTINNKYADENINYLPLGSEFGEMLFHTTVMKPIAEKMENLEVFDLRKVHWKRITYEVKEIERIASRPEPTFTLAHLATPHYPYVFDSDGTYVSFATEAARGMSESYVRETHYLNLQLETLIDSLLKESDTPPIIIIHSDHGSGMGGNLLNADRESGMGEKLVSFYSLNKEQQNFYIKERMKNFITLHLPGVSKESIPEDLSSVNIGRVVLNAYFGTQLKLLPNKNIFNRDEVPGFVDVTDIASDWTLPDGVE